LIKLPPELAVVVAALPTDIRTEIYVEQRMEHLRRNDLLTGAQSGRLLREVDPQHRHQQRVARHGARDRA
jgi:hypothetical protein